MTRAAFFTAIVFAVQLLSAASPNPPQRIVSLSPNTTEMLYGVGAFGRVVGVSRYCTYPSAVSRLPRVGGWQDSNVEQIAALRPDLVVMTDAQVPFVADHLAALGLHTLAVPSRTLEDVYVAIGQIGKATGNAAEAASLIAKTRSSLEQLRKETGALAPVTTILCISRTPGTLNDLYVATEGSYLIQLMSIAGGRSLAAPEPHGYEKLSKEALLSLDPDVIIDLQHTNGSYLQEHPQEVWQQLPSLSAVKRHHVYTVTDDFAVHASQFIANTGWEFARRLHPEIAGRASVEHP
jgi:iron complex transport system substrate-binding protein